MSNANGTQSTAIVANDFSVVAEAGKISNASASDLSKKHFNKIKCDAKVNELKRRLQLAKEKLEDSLPYKRYKDIQKKLKLAKRDAESADNIYMGAVSNGLAGFMPDNTLSQKLELIANETEYRQTPQLAEEV